MLDSPIILPKFTFLCGPPNNGQNELAAELSRLDPELGLFDFREPLRMAAHGLFFNGYTGEDLPDELLGMKTVEFLYGLEGFLENHFGEGALSLLAAEDYKRDGEIYDRLLYRDIVLPLEVKALLTTLRIPHEIALCIHVGVLSATGVDTAHIWLPEPDLPKRIAALRRELSTLNIG